jgi:hypothetical protein
MVSARRHRLRTGFDSAGIFGLGVGYQVNNWFRADVTGQYRGNANFHGLDVTDFWRRTLRRRSQKDGFTWKRMTKLVADWLPPPRILHPWPDERFDVRH